MLTVQDPRSARPQASVSSPHPIGLDVYVRASATVNPVSYHPAEQRQPPLLTCKGRSTSCWVVSPPYRGNERGGWAGKKHLLSISHINVNFFFWRKKPCCGMVDCVSEIVREGLHGPRGLSLDSPLHSPNLFPIALLPFFSEWERVHRKHRSCLLVPTCKSPAGKKNIMKTNQVISGVLSVLPVLVAA